MAKEVQSFPKCETCSQERKPVQLAGGRKKRMARMCACGIYDVDGQKMDIQ